MPAIVREQGAGGGLSIVLVTCGQDLVARYDMHAVIEVVGRIDKKQHFAANRIAQPHGRYGGEPWCGGVPCLSQMVAG